MSRLLEVGDEFRHSSWHPDVGFYRVESIVGLHVICSFINTTGYTSPGYRIDRDLFLQEDTEWYFVNKIKKIREPSGFQKFIREHGL